MKIDQSLEGKHVRVTDVDNETFEGVISDYIYPEDNEPEGIDAIIVDYPVRSDGYKFENPIEFKSSEIRSIEVIS